MSGAAYEDEEGKQYKDIFQSLARGLEYSERWEWKKVFGDRHDGGVIAEYYPNSEVWSPIRVVSFMGSAKSSLLDNATCSAVPASEIDPNLSEVPGALAGQALKHYNASGFSSLLASYNIACESSSSSVTVTAMGQPHILCGHSRGGVLADIAALHLGESLPKKLNQHSRVTSRQVYESTGVITFGKPKLFSPELAAYLDAKLENRNLHFVGEGDQLRKAACILSSRAGGNMCSVDGGECVTAVAPGRPGEEEPIQVGGHPIKEYINFFKPRHEAASGMSIKYRWK